MAEPLKVEIAAVAPVAIEQVAAASTPRPSAPDQRVQQQLADPSVPARTTFQEDLTTAGQRRVNLIWEYTQAIIAIQVVSVTMFAAVWAMVNNLQIPTIVAVAFGMITGFYFSRTNHAAIGGIGHKPQGHYEGR